MKNTPSRFRFTRRVRVVCLFLTVFLAAPATAVLAQVPKDEVPGLYVADLDNGLSVFLFENRVVPLVRVQVTFRCGAYAQTPETAGLFHLYEHMLFKGNEKYSSQAEMIAAMNGLGVANWNGGTSTEYVTYYFTIPSAKLDEGLAFWAAAIRTPSFDTEELRTERDVVANEIIGNFNEPDQVFASGTDRRLFAKYPYRRDVSGSEANVRGATVESMRAIRDTYYLPNNAAVLVGGDVDPAAALALVEKNFGSWRRGADPWKDAPPPHPFLARQQSLVYADESMYGGIASVSLQWRGPDVLADPAATYAADVWGALIDNPSGKFKSNVFAAVPGLYQKEYVSGYYATQRDGGEIDFNTYMFVAPASSTTARGQAFKEAVKTEITAMTESAGKKNDYFSAAEFEAVKTKLEDQMILERETPDQLIQTLSFWWAVAQTDYYFGYVPNMKKITTKDIAVFLDKYVLKHEAVVAVRMNANDFQAEKAAAAKNGFEQLTKANAYWWSK